MSFERRFASAHRWETLHRGSDSGISIQQAMENGRLA
jgi:hypothetical protein